MSSFLNSLFASKKPKKQMVRAVPGNVFAWAKGCWLEATETTVILLPGQLIREGEVIGAIIETSSDDVLIGFTQAPDSKEFTQIRLKLEVGQSATVRRSAQAMVAPDDQKERMMYMRFESSDAA